jgi:hypothetical protein
MRRTTRLLVALILGVCLVGCDGTQLPQLPGIAHAITGVMTNTRRDKMYDNIVFDRRATTEFTGKWGVVDFQKEFNLTQQAALEVSDHCPVWAEFSAYEGAVPMVAGRPVSPQ